MAPRLSHHPGVPCRGIDHSGGGRANEVVLERPDRRRRTAADLGFLVDVLNVVSDRLRRDAEIVCDLLVGLAVDEHEEDLQFTLGQPDRQLARSLRHAVTRGSEHSVDGLRVEPSRFYLPDQRYLSSRRIESRAVRSTLAHRAVAVGGGEDASRLVEARSARAAVVTRAVEPFVV